MKPLIDSNEVVDIATASPPSSRSDVAYSGDSAASVNSPLTTDSEAHTSPSKLPRPFNSEQATIPLDCYVPVGILALDSSTFNEWTHLCEDDVFLDKRSPLSRLLKAKWVQGCAKTTSTSCSSVRVFLLPDDVARRTIPRDDRNLCKSLCQLMSSLDTSEDVWHGCEPNQCPKSYLPTDGGNQDSLFYLFNTVPSPERQYIRVGDPFSQKAIDSLLEPSRLGQLKTPLYTYQKWTAATMVRREVRPQLCVDPRLILSRGPLGHEFYHDCQTGTEDHCNPCRIFLQPTEYEETRGGMLAESMGLGKTLICLATILATKGHFPTIPPAFSLDRHVTRHSTGRLADMAASAASIRAIPWKSVWQDRLNSGHVPSTCIAALSKHIPTYGIPPRPKPQVRRAITSEPQQIRLCATTLVIAPRNLISHWTREIAYHLHKGALSVLVLDSNEACLPTNLDVLSYDIILFSTQRFEQELQSLGSKTFGQGSCVCDSTNGCCCTGAFVYQSPLLSFHFLRVILDEGHEFASGSKNRAYFALSQLRVDCKWVVSGTPASGLHGVEVAMTATSGCEETRLTREEALERRKKDYDIVRERKILQNLRVLIEKFLDLKPWSNSKSGDHADWNTYIMPHDNGRRKPASLRNLLNSLCVRHNIQDVEADITLPPLYNQTVYIRPCLQDKMSQNAFIIALIANAVTSERLDQDYMFHPKNRPALNQLIGNLRQSGFYWTSFKPEELAKTIQISREYLSKHPPQSSPPKDVNDMASLRQAVDVGELILSSTSWNTFSELHEMGLWLDAFPTHCQTWSLNGPIEDGVPMTGATQLWKAQNWVDSHLHLENEELVAQFTELGRNTITRLWRDLGTSKETIATAEDMDQSGVSQVGSSTAPVGQKVTSRKSAITEPKLTEQTTISRVRKGVNVPKSNDSSAIDKSGRIEGGLSMRSALKPTHLSINLMDPSCKVFNSTLCGTSSAKLTYLLDKIAALHEQEKILIFFEGDHIAYYISQALDLVGIRYFIYTRTLDLALKSAYIATFNAKATTRVMLMSLSEAAHGLHIASASRVFFVNPVWQPDIEAQAIKRAHRIGQRRAVYVETLVLEDTIEAQMLRRRSQMSNQEHHNAEKSLLDDAPMAMLIERARLLPIRADEIQESSSQFARLKNPVRLFGQKRNNSIDPLNPYADLIFPTESRKTKKLGIRVSTEVEWLQDEEPHPEDLHLKRSFEEGYKNDMSDHFYPDSRPDIAPDVSKSSDPAPVIVPPKKKKRVGFIEEPTLMPSTLADPKKHNQLFEPENYHSVEESPHFRRAEPIRTGRPSSIFGAGSTRLS